MVDPPPLLLSLSFRALLALWLFRPFLMIGGVLRNSGGLLCWMQSVVVAFGKRSLRTWPLQPSGAGEYSCGAIWCVTADCGTHRRDYLSNAGI